MQYKYWNCYTSMIVSKMGKIHAVEYGRKFLYLGLKFCFSLYRKKYLLMPGIRYFCSSPESQVGEWETVFNRYEVSSLLAKRKTEKSHRRDKDHFLHCVS